MLVIRDLADGRARFCELERSLAGISPRTLSLRLRALEEQGIVERNTYPEVPPRVEYSLTLKRTCAATGASGWAWTTATQVPPPASGPR
jgi:DNA-binding HxlR family transcriptional regulator